MNLKSALSVSSDFSLGNSMLQVDQIVAKAVEHGYENVAIVDDMSIHALADFTAKAKKAGIKPIIGCRLRVYDNAKYKLPPKSTGIAPIPNPFFMLKVYVKSEKGIKGLFKLLSEANAAENFYYHSRTDLESVLALEDVVVTTGDTYGVFSHPNHENIVSRLFDRFGDDLYIELSPINSPLYDRTNNLAIVNAARLEAQTLVTYPFNYAEAGDADTLDVLSAIATNTQLDIDYRPKQAIKDFWFAPPNAMVDRVRNSVARQTKYHGVKDASCWASGLKNIAVVADKCDYTFAKQEVSLPKLFTNEFAELGRKCLIGWKNRFSSPILGHQPTPVELSTIYKDRLSYELTILKKMGFESYFLLVEDLVTWSKNNGVIVGPGRGSIGGSLIAYLLGITDVDPIRFGLIFERFINPDRMDLPDADLDFASSKRHLVIEYLIKKFGQDRVAGISNYSTLASASALRDTGRIHGLSGFELSATKLVPKEHGASANLTTAAACVPEIEHFKNMNPEIWKHAIKLEGVMKSFGQHAAGVIIAGEPITNRAVVETRAGSAVVNWDKRIVEDWGLVKMDLLGLSTLDVLDIAKDYILERHGVVIDYLKTPFEDKRVMDALGRGETTGVFQLESSGMRRLLQNIAKGGDLTFEDISAVTALYRPGPMDSGLLDDYVAVRQGLRPVEYDHPHMEDALKDTLGVIVYQEQVMKVAVDFAGFTNAEADGLRKAMGKKDRDKMMEMEDKWVKGAAAKSGVTEAFAAMIFDKIEKFAGYGFNKSHSVEYSVISVWCAYIRVYYPAEYFAASLSIVGEDKLMGLVKDARECGIEVLPPDINLSADKYTIPDDKHILAPFSSVKGVSETTAKAIVKLRRNNREWTIVRHKKLRIGGTEEVWGPDPHSAVKGKFDSFHEFEKAALVQGSKVNGTVVQNLRLVGAFASVDPSELGARHPDRRKDQVELMPGLIIDSVKADRQTDVSDPFIREKIIMMVQDVKSCEGCDLAGQPHPTVRCGKTVKYMVISDCPSWEEEKKDKLLEGSSSNFIKAAIKAAGLKVGEGYFTTLVKAKKSDKFLTGAQINGCSEFLNRELEIIKPPIIVLLGSAAVKRFLPGVKSSPTELIGKTFYDPKLEATLVVGLNAQQILFDPTKAEGLNIAFEKVAEILS